MKNVVKKILLLSVFISSFSLKAGILLEPKLGFTLSGSGEASGYKMSYHGTQIGARAGFQELGLMGGLAYNHSTFSMEAKGTNSYTHDHSRNEVGVFVGYELPILLRAWVSYFFTNKTNDDVNSAYSFKGNTTEFGVGFTALPFLSLNLEYRIPKWDSGTAAFGNVSNVNFNEIVLGVSLPLNL